MLALCLGHAALAQGAQVTVGEANAVLDKVDAAVRKVLKMAPAEPATDKSKQPVTRAQVIAKLDALFESYRPSFQYTPRPFRTAPEVAAKFNPDPAVRAKIEKLARWGCIGPVGPLVTGPGETLSTAQFGEAVGYFISQVAALTYFADPKWVPTLQPPGKGAGSLGGSGSD